MFIRSTRIFVKNQSQALVFYTEKLGLVKRKDCLIDENRFLTVAFPHENNKVELVLEALNSQISVQFQEYNFKNKIPVMSFEVEDISTIYAQLKEKNVEFPLPLMDIDTAWIAILNDTCGNLIELYENKMQD